MALRQATLTFLHFKIVLIEFYRTKNLIAIGKGKRKANGDDELEIIEEIEDIEEEDEEVLVMVQLTSFLTMMTMLSLILMVTIDGIVQVKGFFFFFFCCICGKLMKLPCWVIWHDS